MIRKIIHLADVHIRPFLRLEEYTLKLNELNEKIKEEIEGYNYDEIRIVVSGDIVHSKNSISNELIAFVSAWIRQLEQFGKVVIISGNHDLMVGNMSRIDTLTAIFTASQFENSIHLDSYLGYDSGIIPDDNVT
jgi:DNA repair exonuclease SbcCD nuclease subunit